MKGGKFQEIDRLNLEPLNRISKQWLETAGVSPDPGKLHALSLIKWALGERAIEVDGNGDPVLAGETVATLIEMGSKWPPGNAMNFLATTDSGAPRIAPDELEQAGSPVDAALKLLGCLTSAVVSNRE